LQQYPPSRSQHTSTSIGHTGLHHYCRESYLRILFLAYVSIIACASCLAQATPFKKSVLDSISANEFNGSFSYSVNLGQDGTSTLTTNAQAGLLYSTKRNNYEFKASSYFDRFGKTSTSNRLFAMARCSLFSHDFNGEKIKEEKLYAEPFTMFVFDHNRAIDYRWQWGVNGVYALKPTKVIRIKVGAGLLYEAEKWQMIKKENLYLIDSLSDDEKNYLFNDVGINQQGELYRNNIRLNLYANFICAFAKNMNLGAYIGIQEPFVPPYHDLPPASVFPVVTKRYPRLTVDTHLVFAVWKMLNLITDFTLQYDKGQIPLYVPNLVYTLTQGFQIDF
jgi:hypothetical protein